MEKIKEVWFEANRLYIETERGEIKSRPLEAFPLLLEATDKQRLGFEIGKLGDDIRWEEIDEDIHISSFYQVVEPQANSIGEAFAQLPQINISKFAEQIGINKSLMAKYIYGIKNPSPERKKQIEEGLRQLADSIYNIKIA